MNIRTLCLIAGCAVAGPATAAPAPIIKTGVDMEISEYRPAEMEWEVSYRMFKYINGEKVFGQWISADDVRDAVRAQQAAARGGAEGVADLEQAFDSLGLNILVSPDPFGFEVCGFGAGTEGARYISAADIWSETVEGISVDPALGGAMVDGIEFGWQPNAIPAPASGPWSPSAFELTPGQHAPCHQLGWNIEIWDTFDAGTDTNMDGLPDTIGAFPILDTMGMPVVDGDGDAGFTPFDMSDADMDGNPDGFLGGYQLFIIGGFNPGDVDGDGTPNTPLDFICPDIDGDGDPFGDFFNPIVGGGWTILGNYAQIGGGNFDSDINTGFTTAIDAGLGLAFDVDGDGNPDVPVLPADGEGSVRIEAFNAVDDEFDGTLTGSGDPADLGIFDGFDGGALVGGVVFNGTDEEFANAEGGMHPVTPGDSDPLTWLQGENRLGEPALTTVTDPTPKPAADDFYTLTEVAVLGDLPGASQTCVENSDATAFNIYVAGGAAPMFLCADANQDGAVTPTDFGAWLNNFNGGTGQADANGDNSITPTDFGAWLNAFNQGAAGPMCDHDLSI